MLQCFDPPKAFTAPLEPKGELQYFTDDLNNAHLELILLIILHTCVQYVFNACSCYACFWGIACILQSVTQCVHWMLASTTNGLCAVCALLAHAASLRVKRFVGPKWLAVKQYVWGAWTFIKQHPYTHFQRVIPPSLQLCSVKSVTKRYRRLRRATLNLHELITHEFRNDMPKDIRDAMFEVMDAQITLNEFLYPKH